MDYNNEMKRLEGHEQMKEIPESLIATSRSLRRAEEVAADRQPR